MDLKGAGVSTTFYNSSVGIATIFFEGGGGSGSIGIGSTFTGGAANGDLFYHIDYGRIFVYYDEVVLGIGTDAFWVDAAPFNVGIITALSNVSFSPGSAVAPSMFFIGDNQTGFFSPGNGQFTVVSSGSSVLNVNASGIRVTGVTTITNASGTVTIGIGTTALLVEGNARVTGILTVGSSSITLDGSNNQLKVGTGVTIHHTNGVQVGGNTFHSTGLSVNQINTTGVITATSFVGSGANLTGVGLGTTGSINTSGVITATSFFGSGSGLTGVGLGTTGSINTSGIITATSFFGSGANLTGVSGVSATGSVNTSGIITATRFSGNGSTLTSVVASALNSSGVSTVRTLQYSGQNNLLIVSRFAGTYTINVSDAGNDTTGDGSSGSPFRTISKAIDMVPDISSKSSTYIKILGASFTHSSSSDKYGIAGGCDVYNGQGITIGADSAITFNMNSSISFSGFEIPIQFNNLNFVLPTNSGAISCYRCKFIYMKSSCTWTSNNTAAGWSYSNGGIFQNTLVDWKAPVSLTATAVSGLGAAFVFDGCPRVTWNANLIKSGTKFANNGISVINGTWLEASGCTISNFATGIANGYNHYSAETGGHTMANSLTLSNNTTGIVLAHGAIHRNYYTIYSGNGTNISSTNSWNT